MAVQRRDSRAVAETDARTDEQAAKSRHICRKVPKSRARVVQRLLGVPAKGCRFPYQASRRPPTPLSEGRASVGGSPRREAGVDDEGEGPMAGQMVHIEIPADDTAASREFWGSLFGWEFNAFPGPSEYHMTRLGLAAGTRSSRGTTAELRRTRQQYACPCGGGEDVAHGKRPDTTTSRSA